MTTDNLDLDALRGLLAAATPGPWEAKAQDAQMSGRSWYRFGPSNAPKVFDSPSMHPGDADLIEALRNQAPAMLAEIERLTRERDAVVEAVRFTLNGWADGQIDDPYTAMREVLDSITGGDDGQGQAAGVAEGEG